MIMADPVTNWIDARIKVAVNAAVDDLHDEITQELQQLRTDLMQEITGLPEEFAGKIGQVVVDAEDIAQKVGAFIKLPDLGNQVASLQNLIGQFTAIPQQIIDAFNPFKR